MRTFIYAVEKIAVIRT